jgi:glucose/arabinose dehydrogenase
MSPVSRLVSWRTRFAPSRTRRPLRRPAPDRGFRPRIEAMEDRLTLSTLPAGFTETTVVSGLSAPTAMDFAPDGRLFVLEQGGAVKLVHGDGTTWTALQLNTDSNGERGLLGIAFDPNFSTDHYVYLYYTNPNPGAASWATGEHNQVSRFTVDDTNPQQPVFTDEAPILDLNNLISATNHNGGAIHFGSDGMLYVDVGDNTQTFTQGGNTYRVSQTLSDMLGKQLRVDVAAFNSGVATRDDTTVGHLIPTDNPFVGTASGINQLIYVLGLRNPYTFAVQPGTGVIFINDVGENVWEEIDRSVAGGNYGWSGGETDGFGQTPPGPGTYQDPLLAYNHSGGPAGGGIAIVGGTFYDPASPQFPNNYVGKYFYADLTGNWIRVFDPSHPGSASDPDTSQPFATNLPGQSRDLKVDAAGSLYYLSGNGLIDKISYSPAAGDAGFEQPNAGPAGSWGSFAYGPTGTAWTFAGSAGVSAAGSGFTSGNPGAPEGAQVGFLQETGSFSQTVTGWAAGTYAITFDAAQRGNYQASQQDFQVLVDGAVVGTFTPSGTSYQAYSTGAFSVAAGSHTITFQGLDDAGGDNTAFLDAVAVAPAGGPVVGDAGFEQPGIGPAGVWGSFAYDPTGTAWTFGGSAGVSADGSGFTAGNLPTPQGSQVAFLQVTGSFSQVVTGWAAGSYVITFDAAQRGNYQASQQDFEVLVDGTVVGTFTPTGTPYQGFITARFTVAAGAHTIAFQGLDSAGGDNTALIDDVSVHFA